MTNTAKPAITSKDSTSHPGASVTISPQEERAALSVRLKSKGFRLTPQREKILDIFFYLPEGQHLSADDLYNLVRNDSSDVSLATTYRTLHLLHSIGVLRELDFAEDHKHYELLRDEDTPHHHLICVNCGTTEEFESTEVVAIAQQVAGRRQFVLTDIQLKLYGLCKDCH
jgi:Fur family ferric uptake transcriptional regulator